MDYSQYENLNDVPEMERNEKIDNLKYEDYPHFSVEIWANSGLKKESKQYFFRKFLTHYLLSEEFKQITSNYVFYFVIANISGFIHQIKRQ